MTSAERARLAKKALAKQGPVTLKEARAQVIRIRDRRDTSIREELATSSIDFKNEIGNNPAIIIIDKEGVNIKDKKLFRDAKKLFLFKQFSSVDIESEGNRLFTIIFEFIDGGKISVSGFSGSDVRYIKRIIQTMNKRIK